MSVTAATAKLHIETDLADAQVTRLINDAELEVTARFGSDTDRTEDFTIEAPRRRIWLGMRASAISGGANYVKEGAELDDLTAIAAADVQLTDDGWVVEKDTGDFLRRVKVRYTPVSDTYRRDRVVIDLVRLAIQHSGLSSLRDGDHSEEALDYQAEREKILSTLNHAKRAFA